MNSLANTACWTAAIRACESERPDRLFTDPLARALAGEEGFRLLGGDGPQVGDVGVYVAIRTRFFDDFIGQAMGAGLRQVVMVAAGMDARAFRLAWPPGTTVFELDTPESLAVKNSVLATEGAVPKCTRVCVPVDLKAEWTGVLRSSGFREGEAALWIAEGLFFYLEAAAVAALLERISGMAAPGSMLGADFVSESFLTSPWMTQALESLKERGMEWLSGVEEPETALAGYGWTAEARQPGEEGAGAGRWPYPLFPRSYPAPRSFLVTAVR